MKFSEALEKLNKSDIFCEWSRNNKNCYLVHGFLMLDPNVKQEWQIGFYDPGKDNITTFNVNSKITKNPESEVFKEEKRIGELEPDNINFFFDDACEKAEKLQKEKYPRHLPVKKIFVLQKLSGRQVWNITFVTQTFKTLNMKFDSKTGEIISDQLISLFRIEK